MREVRQKELEQEKRVKGAQLSRLQRSNEKEALAREVASQRRDFTHKYVHELIGAQRLELQLSQQLAHASTALEKVCSHAIHSPCAKLLHRLLLLLSLPLFRSSSSFDSTAGSCAQATTQRNEGEHELRALRGRAAEDEARHARVVQQSQHMESIAGRGGTPVEAHFALTQPKPLPGATTASA